jgi:hypothetical protein
MTSLAVAALDFNSIALPQPLLHSQLLAGDSLVLLKCDATNYEQVCAQAAVTRGCTYFDHLQDTLALLHVCLSGNAGSIYLTYKF